MTTEEWHRITTLFHGALARDPPSRDAFLDEACGADAGLRAQVERLLAAHLQAGEFGESPLPAFSLAPPSDLPPSLDAPTDLSAAADSLTSAASSPELGRRQPFLAGVGLAAALVLVTFTYAAWLLVLNGGTAASQGWSEEQHDGGWLVTGVDPTGPAASHLRVGDRIVSLGEAPPFAVVGTAPHRRPLAPGDTYHLTIEREGRQLAMTLSTGATDSRSRLVTRVTYFFSSLLWCLIGLWIGAARPQNPVARLATAVALSVGLLFLTLGVFESLPRWGPLHVVLGYHFFSRFPTGAVAGGWWRAALWGLYLTGGVSVVSGLGFDGIVLAHGLSDAAQFDWLLRVRESLAVIGFTGAVVAMMAVIPRNYWLLTTEDQRRRVRWVLYAACVGLAPEVWWAAIALIETFIGPAGVPRLTLIANIAPVVIPLSVAYVVVRHRVLDISVVIRRTVQYLLARRMLQTTVAIPVLALLYTVATHRHLTIAELVGDTRAYLFWLGASALALRFRRPIEGALDRRFFREEYDREQLLLGVLEEVRRVDSIAELARVVTDRLAFVLHPTSAYVWYRDPAELAAASSSDPQLTPADVPANGAWLSWLEARGEAAALPLPAEAGLSRREARWFSERGVSLIVPLMDSGDRLVGTFMLGEKRSEEPYSAGDTRLLSAIARQAAVVRENLRLRARVDEEVRVKYDVLARLDSRVPNLLKECPACGACYEGALECCPADGRLLALSLPVARTIDGRYRLERLLGTGGMGAVYEARDLRLERMVAVKILLGRAFGQPAALRRFHREARATARLNHPNIVALYDYGSLEGEGAYLVMERVQGVTLRAELERRRSLPPAVAADWFEPLLEGLAAAHAAGIIHRDLKPENVMGRQTPSGTLLVKLLDLGLVKFHTGEPPTSGSMTAQGIIMGTPGYMAPEQLFAGEVDQRTDLFAVGVMLIEVLTGQRPLPAMDPRRSRSLARWSEQVRGPSLQLRTLERLLRRCLAEDPRERFPSADALREELIPLLRTYPPLAATSQSP